jgi:hypothetical protein
MSNRSITDIMLSNMYDNKLMGKHKKPQWWAGMFVRPVVSFFFRLQLTRPYLFFPLCFLRTCDMRHAQVQKADGIDYICIYSFTTLCPIRDKEYRCCTDPASLDQRTNGDQAARPWTITRP